MSILNSSITSYEIKSPSKIFARHWNVEDKQGNNLGKIKTGFGEFGTYTLLDSNDSVLLTCKKKFTFRGQTFEIKDSSNERIGLVKKQGQTRFSKEIWMENKEGNEIFRSEVPLGANIVEEIYDGKGDVIGKFSGVNESRSKLSNAPEGWTLDFFNPSLNKVQLWGLFLSVLNVFKPIDWINEGGDMGG
jgi:hypothetical protein